MKRFLVMEIGCLECGVESAIAGLFDTQFAAEDAVRELNERLYWRDGGQNIFLVFDLAAPIDPIFTLEHAV